MAHPNEKVLRKMDDAMGKGDIETMFSTLADDVVVHIGGRSKLAGDLKGKGELQENFGKFIQTVGEDADFDTHAILADDEHGIILQAVISKRAGSPGAIPAVGIFHFKDGKISEAWFTDLDPYTADAFYDSAQ
jgi:ketosteroid isomerase-like protein